MPTVGSLKSTQGPTSDGISPEAREAGATKYDAGKPSVYRGVVDYFPRAILEVARVSTFGASKYAWGGWRSIPDGYNRVRDAGERHKLEQAKGNLFDEESGYLHLTHEAWNILAALEYTLKEMEDAERRLSNDA